MSEHKMGTHYVREVAEMFRATAASCKFDGLKSKLESLANDIEPLAAKLYFKTQKGTEDMEKISGEMGDLKAKLASLVRVAVRHKLRVGGLGGITAAPDEAPTLRNVGR